MLIVLMSCFLIFQKAMQADIITRVICPTSLLYIIMTQNLKKITIPCEGSDVNNIRSCSRRYVLGSRNVLPVEFSYYRKFFIQKIRSCEVDENFNTDTQQCQKCPDGQSWNPATNSCFVDCSDINKNKYGFMDGSCADCSSEKDSDGVKKCYCNFIGSSPLLQSVELIKGNFIFTRCQNGSEFWYKIPGTPDVDNNKTKPDLKKPSPGGNGTKPDDPNNPNQGGGSQGGNQGGNNGGNQGDNTNPDSKDGDLCKKIPKILNVSQKPSLAMEIRLL